MGTIPHTIDGKPYSFPVLQRKECVALVRKAFDNARLALITDATDANLEPPQFEVALTKLREQEGTYFLLHRYARTLEGVGEVLSLSMAKMNGAAKPDLEECTDDSLIALSLRLCGFEVKELKPEDDDGFVDNRPT